MEDSEGLDLDSLIDLLDDDTNSENTPGVSNEQDNGFESTNKSYANVIQPMKNSSSDAADVISTPKCTKLINAEIDFLSSCVSEKSVDGKILDASQNNKVSLVHTGDTSEEEEDEKEILTETGQQIKKNINVKSHYRDEKKEINTWNSKANSSNIMKEKVNSFDSLTGIRIVNPLVAFDVLEKRLQGRRLIKMSFMKNFLNKGDIEGDWITVGVVAKKVPPKTSKAGKVFSIWKMTDLHDPEKLVSLFLFGAVHSEHWKTSVGTVVGLLNPVFMESKDREDYACIKIDHPGKMMLIGTAKDFGHCKSARKDGVQCSMIVNLSQCQYCAFHVKKEYKKFSSKRTEIQTSWTGRDFSLKDKVLKGQNFFYGGQSLVPLGKPERKSSISSKDKLTLSNLGLKRKAAVVFNEEKSKSVKKVVEIFGSDISKVAEKNSAFINNQLTIPSAGSRNLLQHMVKNKATKETYVSSINPKDLLKQHAFNIKSRTLPIYNKKSDDAILKNLIPVLGKGLNPSQNIVFDISAHNSNSPVHYAKMRAIQRIKHSGPIEKKDPNSTKSKPEPQKIKAVLECSFEEKIDDKCSEEKQVVQSSALGVIDLNSEKVKRYLNQKSSHEYEVEMAEMLKEAAYFERLEKKEMMEEKMSSTREIVCDVVSCKQCRYTAHHAAERCKDEHHPLKCHKAVKRFFECQDCKRRTECFTRFPRRSCRNCGGSRFQRTSMIKVRSGPKLDSENLNIRGDEAKFLNSL